MTRSCTSPMDSPEGVRAVLAPFVRAGRLALNRFVDAVFEEPDHAVRLLIFEEVGLDERSIGSPLAAGIGSFLAFTSGAFVPLVPYLLAAGTPAFVASLTVSLLALALMGVGISRLTRRPMLFSALRQVLLGGVAAAVTYAVGSVIGTTVL